MMTTAVTVPPIFILSSPRSGSTLLRCIVDTHPDICSPPQLDLGALCERLFRSVYYSLGQLTGSECEKERVAIEETRLVVSGLMARYTLGKGKKQWCEKTTENTSYLPIIEKIFPDARYVCLYRNCLDVVHSCIRFNPLGYMPELAPFVGRRPDNFVAAMMEGWLETNRKQLDFETENHTRCFRVRYETLVADPKAVLPYLFEFLGADWNDALLEAIFTTPHDRGEGDIKVWLSKAISKDSVGKGSAIPKSRLPKDLVQKADQLHEKIGYPPVMSYYASSKTLSDTSAVNSDNGTGNKRQIATEEISGILTRKKDELESLRGVCNLIVQGANGGEWRLDFSGASPTIESGCAGNANCTLTISGSSMADILDGKMTVIDAYEQGEVASSGDLSLTIQFGTLLLGGHEKNDRRKLKRTEDAD
ncbi:sulfotransferase [Candidatus Methylospira mobilis]|nr:sulfotransferase [Candidatus Methylospira mobilis]